MGGYGPTGSPFFGGLEVEVWLSSPNSRLGIREENDSAAEALHEDIYFNTLDTIEVLGLSSTGDKTSAPGPVVPIVHVRDGIAPHAVVRLLDPPPAAPSQPNITVAELSLEDGELVAGLVGPFDEYSGLSEVSLEPGLTVPRRSQPVLCPTASEWTYGYLSRRLSTAMTVMIRLR